MTDTEEDARDVTQSLGWMRPLTEGSEYELLWLHILEGVRAGITKGRKLEREARDARESDLLKRGLRPVLNFDDDVEWHGMTDEIVEHDTIATDSSTCPGCGEANQDWWDGKDTNQLRDGSEWEEECPFCEAPYTVTMCVSTSFSTEKFNVPVTDMKEPT